MKWRGGGKIFGCRRRGCGNGGMKTGEKRDLPYFGDVHLRRCARNLKNRGSDTPEYSRTRRLKRIRAARALQGALRGGDAGEIFSQGAVDAYGIAPGLKPAGKGVREKLVNLS